MTKKLGDLRLASTEEVINADEDMADEDRIKGDVGTLYSLLDDDYFMHGYD